MGGEEIEGFYGGFEGFVGRGSASGDVTSSDDRRLFCCLPDLVDVADTLTRGSDVLDLDARWGLDCLLVGSDGDMLDTGGANVISHRFRELSETYSYATLSP